ncbi:MAG: tol-pal system protein YbgF [Alphaproteobacteria bacterium]|jgi:tol-pal system protein YbgF|nr:tol-pal system protein YbgF [Alphaproteobacteria bacterium]
MERYEYSYSLLRRLRLEDAETAFQEFLAVHGEHSLAGTAQYWLGEIYFTRSQLRKAAEIFLEGIRRYPDSRKTPDSMLKLAIVFRKLGRDEEACGMLQQLQSSFPDDSRMMHQILRSEKQRSACG